MQRWVFLAFLLGCGGEATDTDSAAVGVQGVDCVTCNRGLTDATCDLCAVCAGERRQGLNPYAVAGCLPVEDWCASPLSSHCRVQVCGECGP